MSARRATPIRKASIRSRPASPYPSSSRSSPEAPMRHAASIARLIFLPSILSFPARVTAQQQTPPAPVQRARPLALPTLRPPVADTGTFSPLPFPPGNDRRTADGSPGPAYWQQRVDYQIQATLDTSAKRLIGTESIGYTNNSPDSLRFIWMQLDQNLFRPGSTGSLLFASESRFGGGGFQGGFQIDSVLQCVAPETQQPAKN